MRQVAALVGLLVLVAGVIVGGDFFGLRTQLLGEEPPEPRTPVTDDASEGANGTSGSGETPAATRVRSQPWWQTLTTLESDGESVADVTIDEGALQWRLRWECESGSLLVEVAGREEPVVDTECPDSGTAFLTQTGDATVEVDGGGPRNVEIEQQIDVPLEEPPTAEMESPDAEEIARGSFYDIDQTGRGEVVIYRLGDGTYALRLVDFFVTPNVDLELRLSEQDRPETTEEFDRPASDYVATLRATTGSMNFRVPDDIDPTQHDSLVIWCPPVQNAYAAASFEHGE